MPTRKKILQLLSKGKIDVTRATEMLGKARASGESEAPTASEAPRAPTEPEAAARPAVPPPPPTAPDAPLPPIPPVTGKTGRWLHIHVNDLESGKNRVKVNVPLGLVNVGLRLGAHFTNELDAEMVRDVMDALQDDAVTGTLVEVEDIEDNERVHIFID